ncbi:MAG: serine/threonine-protein kinase [Verrucomicrobiota bacterium]
MTQGIDKLLFAAASNFAGKDEQRDFLEYACRGDEAQLRRLEEMLEIQHDAEEFFEWRPEVNELESVVAEDAGQGGIGARIGPYRLMDRLGSGGCGVVYLAEQSSPVKRKVALKIIRMGMDTESVIARFALEREALALMDHPNIARVLDAGATASGRPYFVMELVDGEKITDFCDRKRLGLRQRLELFILVCEAIQHAHQKGVIHRDIKPSNVLVREHEGRMEPKVIDFGIAKATAGSLDAESTVTHSGQLIGTPAYMSPEQAEGGVDVDTRSDIYSLGAMLCEILTGAPPLRFEQFKNCRPDEIRHLLRDNDTGMPSAGLAQVSAEEIGRIASCRGVDAHKLPSLLAGDLDWIVMKAVDKDRQCRYGTATGLAMDVTRHLRGEMVLARPPSASYRISKWIRRNRLTFAAGSIALFGLSGGFGISTWLFFRERDARQEQARLRIVAEEARAVEVRLRESARAGDLVAQAAVLLRYNEKAQADRLVDGLPADRVPYSLESANTFKTLANWNLEEGRRKEAVERFNLLARVLTSVDMADSENISHSLMPTLTAVCEWGAPGEYETLRKLVVERFSNTANPIVAEQVIKSVLIEPADGHILRKIEPLAELLRESLEGKTRATEAHMIAWRQFSLALMTLRQGNLKAARARAEQSLITATNSPSRAASNRIVIAMADIREGRVVAARGALEEVREILIQWESEPFRIVDSDGYLWINWGIVRILLKEADRMVQAREG